jgi:uncharacterized membrane protein
MLPVLFALLGIAIGGPLFGDWFASALAGLALGLILDLRRRVAALELERALRRLRESVPAPRPLTEQTTERTAEPDSTLLFSRSVPPTRAVTTAQTAAASEIDILAEWDRPTGRAGSARADAAATGAAEPWWVLARNWLLGGNLMVRAGVVVLFFGVAFLLKLAAEHALLPIELRLSAVAVGGLLLLSLGWRLRQSRPLYGLALQGGGVGLFYLTVFAALRLYALIPPGPAFAVLAVVAAGAAALAVLQNAQVLAVLGAVGGFLAPVLTAAGTDSHVGLFSYYLVLNLGILVIAWFRPWQALNRVGFVFTFVIASLWGYRFYRPDHFTSTEPFLIAFAVLYVAVALLFARGQPPESRDQVDASLVFGVPLVGFALQAGLVQRYEYGLAWSAFAAAVFYSGLAGLGFVRRGAVPRPLTEVFLAIGVVFATLVVPLALDARWTAGLWALEGAAMVWVGGRQGRLEPRLFGYLLQIGAALALLLAVWEAPAELPVLNGLFVGALCVALAGVYTAWHLQRHPEAVPWETLLYRPFLVWGLLWWYGAWITEIADQVGQAQPLVTALALCFTASALLADRLRWTLPWPDLRWPARALLPLLYLLLPLAGWLLDHPFTGWTLAGWGAGLLGHLYLLRREEDGVASEPALLALLHQAGFWLVLILLSWESAWRLDHWMQGADTWPSLAWALIPAAGMLTLRHLGGRLPWPVSAHPRVYREQALVPVGCFLWGWVLVSCLVSRGDATPLAYLPLLNPLDMGIGLALLVLADWLYRVGLDGAAAAPDRPAWRWPFAPWALGLTLFLWLNSAWFRTAYHWLGVSFSPAAMLGSQTVQAGLAVLWALAGLICMVLGHHLAQRRAWFAGAALMGVVVLKLFLVDLSSSGTLARIVAFLSVGVLLLVVGYFAPLPPRAKA